LSIVKHIAQLHGGSVEAESELGKGTTVSVVLPIAHE
jgi:two-component system phosphate regulon sensor histidine kinase PhoR